MINGAKAPSPQENNKNMSRCKSCNRLLNATELLMDQEDGSPEDMCYKCRDVLYDDQYEHECMFENLVEGITKARNMKNC